MNELAKGTCIPCKGGVPPLKGEELGTFLEKLGNGWKIIKEHHLEKEYLGKKTIWKKISLLSQTMFLNMLTQKSVIGCIYIMIIMETYFFLISIE